VAYEKTARAEPINAWFAVAWCKIKSNFCVFFSFL
jgi:hypothetical protein